MPPQEMTGICNSVRPNRRIFIGQEDNGGLWEGQKFIVCGAEFCGGIERLELSSDLAGTGHGSMDARG